jgi:PrtD family type I secretion system ABC transporter
MRSAARTDISAPSALSAAFWSCRAALMSIVLISCITNLLMLTGPLFMLQIYDRVLASRSVPTLVALTALVGVLFIFHGLFELIRSRISARIARRIDEQVQAPLFAAVLEHTIKRSRHIEAHPLRDLDTLRQFLSGPSPATLSDLPWTPIYLAVIFLLHPSLSILAVLGAGLLAIVALLTDWLSRKPILRSGESAAVAHRVAEESRRNAAVICAMGMRPAMQLHWQGLHGEALAEHVSASDRIGALSALAKTIRLFLQSAILALGAYLAIEREITSGTIIAASIIMARALSPIEQGISHWRGFTQFRNARRRLARVLADLEHLKPKLALPKPRGHLRVENLAIAAPGDRRPILRDVSFALEPGQALGIVGPTGAGKSTLARALVNVWPPLAGTIAMDGAPYHQWDGERLGRSIGYLPQEVELFDGTFDENIARFQPDAESEAVIAAARLAGVHDLILRFPQGYKTPIGEAGAKLSAGQRQRIGLARALYGDPAMLVMDEPNANLDAVGEAALHHAIRSLKTRKVTVVVIAHRPGAIAAVDLLLALHEGRQFAFGAKNEVLKAIAGNSGDNGHKAMADSSV